EHGFLSGPTPRIVLSRCFSSCAVFDLGIGIDARDEELAVALDHLRDPQAFHDVDAGSDDGHGVGARSWGLGAGGILKVSRRCRPPLTKLAPRRGPRPPLAAATTGVPDTPLRTVVFRDETSRFVVISRAPPAIVGRNRGIDNRALIIP